MIKNLPRDMNRSRDVKGPELKRPNDKEIEMSKDGLGDYADTGVLSKHPLSELHSGEHEGPLKASGMQSVKVDSAMGEDHASSLPSVRKGGGLQGHGPILGSDGGGKGMREAKGMGRSAGKKLGYAAKEKNKY